MQETTRLPRIPIIAGIAAFLIHLACNPHYGFHRDELYFIVCGQHPAWNYVEQPAVAPLLAAATQVFGPSLFLLRAVPAMFAGAGVYVTCLLVIELGGAAYAQMLAAFVVFFIPVLTDFGMKVSPDMVGLWSWPVLALLILRMTKGASPRLWLLAGGILGLSINSKYNVIFFALALLLGLLLTPERRVLWSWWFAAGIALAALISLPAFLWQVQYGYPMLEVLHNTHKGKNVEYGPVAYLAQQALLSGLLFWVWGIGIIVTLVQRGLRFIGLAYIALIAIMILMHGKSYYPANIYPCLVAAGAVQIAYWARSSRVARLAAITVLVLLGLTTLPFVLPVLTETQLVAYQKRFFAILHLSSDAVATETNRKPELVEDFANMHGWDELASTVRNVYQSLPPEERSQAVVLAQNYGEAGAIEFLNRSPRIPVISGHNNYYLWGPRGYTGNVLICVGGNCNGVSKEFERCSVEGSFDAKWIEPYEQGVPIMLCRGLKRPLAELWPKVKLYL
jgi:hypothetical protein